MRTESRKELRQNCAPPAFVSVMVAWWCALWYAKTGEEPYAVRKFIVAGASAEASNV